MFWYKLPLAKISAGASGSLLESS